MSDIIWVINLLIIIASIINFHLAFSKYLQFQIFRSKAQITYHFASDSNCKLEQ